MGEINIQVENAVKEAIKMEINGRDFYDHAAEVTHNELGKKMFQKLAQEEIKHIETFSRLISSILKGENWKSYIRDGELKGKSPLVEELASRIKHAEGKSEIEALSIAMEFEEKGIAFYQRSAGEVDDLTSDCGGRTTETLAGFRILQRSDLCGREWDAGIASLCGHGDPVPVVRSSHSQARP